MFFMALTFGCALLSGCILTPFARLAARRCGAVDRPDGKRKLHAAPVPLWGGVAVYVAFLVGLFVAGAYASNRNLVGPESSFALVLAVAAGFVCLVGCVDDSLDLKPRFKLLLQCTAVVPIVLAGFYVEKITLFGLPLELGWVGMPLTVLWLVACINALNLLDGMDGLASTVGISSAIMLALIAYGNNNDSATIVASALVGALLAFLIYNLPPASIYLGDSGSMVIGLVLGVLAIQGTQKTTATLSIAVPALVMTIPMLDTALAIVRRWLTGRRFDAADRGHLHHRLLDRGLSNWQALRIIGVLCLTTGAAAATAVYLRSEVIAWITGITIVAFAVRQQYIGHHELALIKMSIASLLTRLGNRLLGAKSSLRAMRSTDLSAIPFSECWKLLREEAANSGASSLEVIVGSDSASGRKYTWRQPDSDNAAKRGWTFTANHATPEGKFCEVTVTSAAAEVTGQWTLLQLVDVLKPVEKYWSSAMSEQPTITIETLSRESQEVPERLLGTGGLKRAA